MPAHLVAISAGDLESVVLHTDQLATRGPIIVQPESPQERLVQSAGFVPERTSRPAPELTLSDAQGRRQTLTELRGRIVVLNFWGTTCEHCPANMPKLRALADQQEPRGLSILNVCADAESAELAQQLVESVSPSTRAWIDETGLSNGQFEVQALPTIWLIDRDGTLLASARGMTDWQSAEFRKLFATLVEPAMGDPQ